MIERINIFITAGYPKLNSLPVILNRLIASGIKTVEIGFPYSDPLADGPVIQESSMIAIENGITPEIIFNQLEEFKGRLHLIPMAYLNTLMQFGVDQFIQRCHSLGIKDVILPDMPLHIYQQDFKLLFEKYGVRPIFLVSPNTENERIKQLANETGSFLYAVSSSSTTGNNNKTIDVSSYLENVKIHSKKPVACGFNIKSREDVESVLLISDYAIIGSEFIRQFKQKDKTIELVVDEFTMRYS